jgi:hypothetical protein
MVLKQMKDTNTYMDGSDFASVLREVMAARRPDIVTAVSEITSLEKSGEDARADSDFSAK